MLRFSRWTPALFLSASLLPSSFSSVASASTPSDLEKAPSVLHLSLKISEAGKIEADAEKWKLEKDPEGTELFTAKSGPETRVAAMKSAEGGIDSLTTYALTGETKAEASSTLFFSKNKLTAFTNCADGNEKTFVGRVCVTATPKLCQNLKKNEGIDPETLKEVDLFEMRSLAVILTLRGSDHQLENVVKSGNRLGLKSSLQTTKGLIYTLAKKAKGEIPAASQTVLDKSIPRLKDACLALQM